MAAEDPFSSTSDAAAFSLLRSLRAGAVDRSYVHRVDVCAATPEDLVANLEPVPGTDLAGDGYSSIWYFYCPKRYKNTQGKASGHRHRAIAGGDSCWHSETRPKPVNGLDGATLCTLSYGRKEGSSRSFNRMGWCMTEYDVTEEEGGGGHVLCKVYRSSSSLARGKLKPSPSSSRTAPSEQTAQRSSGSKRKATADQVQIQTRPTKINHAQPCADQEFCYLGYQVQQQQFCFLDQQEQFDLDPMPLLEDDQETMPADHQEQLVYDPTISLVDNGQETMPVDDQELFDYDPIMRLLEEDDPEPPNTGAINPRAQVILNELIRICCGPPTAVAPPNAASLSLEALAF